MVLDSSALSNLMEADPKCLNLNPFLCSVSVAGGHCQYWSLSHSVFGYPAGLSARSCCAWERSKVLCHLPLEQETDLDGLETWSPCLIYGNMCLHEETWRSYCSLWRFSENLYRHCSPQTQKHTINQNRGLRRFMTQPLCCPGAKLFWFFFLIDNYCTIWVCDCLRPTDRAFLGYSNIST